LQAGCTHENAFLIVSTATMAKTSASFLGSHIQLQPPEEPQPEGLASPPHRHKHFRAAIVLSICSGLVAVSFGISGHSVFPWEGTGAIDTSTSSLRGEVTQLESDRCAKYPYLKFIKTEYSNLANRGPDRGRGEGIVYRTLDLGGGAGDEYGKEVLLVINATSAYFPFASRLNGMTGKYGSINLRAGSSVDLRMRMYDAETMALLVMPEMAFTFFDLDAGHNGASQESVSLNGFSSYHLTSDTELVVTTGSDGGYTFTASTYGNSSDNPKDPMFLTEQQKNRAVSLLFHQISDLTCTLKAGPGRNPRFFIFVGRPSLLCAVTVQAGFKPPLPDLHFQPPREVPVVPDEGQIFVKWTVHKGQDVKKGDVLCRTSKKGGMPVSVLAPCFGRVKSLQRLVPGDEIDMRLSDKTIAVIQSEHLLALKANGTVQKAAVAPAGHAFKSWLTQVGKVVVKGDPVAELWDEAGKTVQMKVTHSGFVAAIQNGLRPHEKVDLIEDHNLATVSKFPALEVKITQVPTNVKADDIFVKYLKKKGDHLRKGDKIIMVRNKLGVEQYILSQEAGRIVNWQANLREGMIVGDALKTEGLAANLATIDMGTSSQAQLYFNAWLREVGALVQPGDAIAEIKDANGRITKLRAERGGVIIDRVDLKQGDLVRGITNSNVAKIGRFAPLSVKKGQAATVVPSGMRFRSWLKHSGDLITKGDSLATLDDMQGRSGFAVAATSGLVVKQHEALKPGMPIDRVMEDHNVATVGKLHSLKVETGEGGVDVPDGHWFFKEWRAKTGDTVKAGDPICEVKQASWNSCSRQASTMTLGAGADPCEAVLQAPKDGVVRERQELLRAGYDLGSVLFGPTIAVVSKLPGPGPVGFREVTIDAPEQAVFKGWLVQTGDHVMFGDPIAEVMLPLRLLREANGTVRRLEGITHGIPSPAMGTVTWEQSLNPDLRIGDQQVGRNIAKLRRDLPYWLFVLCAIGLLMGILIVLFYSMKEASPHYSSMKTPQLPEKNKLLNANQDWADLHRPGIDFTSGDRMHTVYPKYRPLGIKHGFTAPIFVNGFTVNSYAKRELGVEIGWKLVRVGNTDLDENPHFGEVNDYLSDFVKNFPVYPLILEFSEGARRHKAPSSRPAPQTFRFSDRPIGIDLSMRAPFRVTKVHEDSPAHQQGILVGWELIKIGDWEVENAATAREVLTNFNEGVQALDCCGRNFGQ